MKRALDIVISFVGIIVLSPIILAVSIILRVTLGKPVFFRQMRTGLNGKPFKIYKFRTMANIYDENGDLLPRKYRLTKIGNFLRKFSLDELPQFFNVLKGDLSLVGPRPLLADYLKLYTSEQMRRHEIRPGITGWAQVNGRNAISWEEKFEFDLWYVDNRSFWVDLKILWLTLMKVFKRQEIDYSNKEVTSRFSGSEKK